MGNLILNSPDKRKIDLGTLDNRFMNQNKYGFSTLKYRKERNKNSPLYDN